MENVKGNHQQLDLSNVESLIDMLNSLYPKLTDSDKNQFHSITNKTENTNVRRRKTTRKRGR